MGIKDPPAITPEEERFINKFKEFGFCVGAREPREPSKTVGRRAYKLIENRIKAAEDKKSDQKVLSGKNHLHPKIER